MKESAHRLNRGGNREANCALYIIALGRMYRHEPTRTYVTRRTAEGLSKPEIIRCLKPFITREIFRALPGSVTPLSSHPYSDSTSSTSKPSVFSR